MRPKVYIIGVGMATPESLTEAARLAVLSCPVLVGAPRLLEPWREGKDCHALIAAGDILDFLEGQETGPVAVLLSGDVGFYSGAKNLWPLLERYEVETLPGISSLSYFCARIRMPWQDVHMVSAHGRAVRAAGEVQSHQKTFFLTGGQARVQDVCRELTDWGMGEARVWAGERLSYPEERIVTGTAEELSRQSFDNLAVLLCENPRFLGGTAPTPGIPDGDFLRGNIPMTKEEVRVISLAKLRLRPDHTLWDVGAGTGSVSVEAGLSLPMGRVFSVEKKPEALELLEKNRARFGVWNLHITAGTAPEALEDLPAPDRIFLGGTSGSLEEILRLALQKNPALRVVANAVTLETLAEAVRCFELLGLCEVDITQVAVTRTRQVGTYHMLDAQNPVWVISGEGKTHG